MFIYDNDFILSFYSDLSCYESLCPEIPHIHMITFKVIIYGLATVKDFDYKAMHDWINDLKEESPLLPVNWTLEKITQEFYNEVKKFLDHIPLNHLVVKATVDNLPFFNYTVE